MEQSLSSKEILDILLNQKQVLEQYLSAKDICSTYRISRATFYRMLKRGELPSPVTLSLRARRWKASDINKVMDERESTHGR